MDFYEEEASVDVYINLTGLMSYSINYDVELVIYDHMYPMMEDIKHDI